MFNAFEATHRFKGKTTKDSPSTAGSPKVVTVTARSKSELKELGSRMGWTAGPRTMAEINAMSSQQILWEEVLNTEQYEQALALPAKIKEGKDIDRQWAIKRMWEGKVSPEQDERARAAGDAFAMRHPTFARTIENAMLMVEYMESRGLDATEISSYSTAFQELSAEGKLMLAVPESADEFLYSHPELKDNRVPPLVGNRHQRDQSTAAHFAKSAAATREGSVTRVVDYPQERHGVAPEPDRYSFKQKIRSMSAAEIAQRCQDDPAFKKSLDELT